MPAEDVTVEQVDEFAFKAAMRAYRNRLDGRSRVEQVEDAQAAGFKAAAAVIARHRHQHSASTLSGDGKNESLADLAYTMGKADGERRASLPALKRSDLEQVIGSFRATQRTADGRLVQADTDRLAGAVLSLVETASLSPRPLPTRKEVETFESIIAWGDEVFGPCTAERAVSRGKEELVEADDETPGTSEHAVEIADTIICFLRVPGILDAINAKMAKNRARKWNLRGDGTGYHVKEPSA